MKTLFFLLLSISAFAQDLTYDQVSTSTKDMTGYFTSYTSKAGEVFKIGDKITIGKPSNGSYFSYIDEGDGVMTPLKKAGTRTAGDIIEIKKIDVWGNKRTGFYASIRTVGGLVGYSIKIELAIESGEVVSSVLTSDQALAALKSAKDKLDLGLITQMEFDSIKAVLAPIIK